MLTHWFIYSPLIYSSALKTSAIKPIAPKATTISDSWHAYLSVRDVPISWLNWRSQNTRFNFCISRCINHEPDVLHKSIHWDIKVIYIAILKITLYNESLKCDILVSNNKSYQNHCSISYCPITRNFCLWSSQYINIFSNRPLCLSHLFNNVYSFELFKAESDQQSCKF